MQTWQWVVGAAEFGTAWYGMRRLCIATTRRKTVPKQQQPTDRTTLVEEIERGKRQQADLDGTYRNSVNYFRSGAAPHNVLAVRPRLGTRPPLGHLRCDNCGRKCRKRIYHPWPACNELISDYVLCETCFHDVGGDYTRWIGFEKVWG